MSRRQVGAPSPESEPFWEATRDRRLVLQWCCDCDKAVQFPRAFCPHCHGSRLEWRQASGRGVVHALTIENKPEAMGEAERYVVALVDLEEGHRLMTNVVGIDPDEVQIGQGLEVRWEELEDGRHLPVFGPKGG